MELGDWILNAAARIQGIADFPGFKSKNFPEATIVNSKNKFRERKVTVL